MRVEIVQKAAFALRRCYCLLFPQQFDENDDDCRTESGYHSDESDRDRISVIRIVKRLVVAVKSAFECRVDDDEDEEDDRGNHDQEKVNHQAHHHPRHVGGWVGVVVVVVGFVVVVCCLLLLLLRG